ncbi:unnamed protein product [Adineta ricciae]|uniref:Serpentine receptor class gamma n=2 Tax=Adineta ricciae TaxID=249248 RepID=A0A815VGA4_ADIRI|nr:unnamed protein product [Adineta ricciae]
MAWASIERHILIFYPKLLETTSKRICFHYLPLTFVSVWPLIFYLMMLIIIPCDAPLNYNRRLGGRYDCVGVVPWIGMFDSIAHYMVPAFIIVVFSIGLFVRVVYHRYHLHHRIDWRSYRKMAVQLLSISLVYMALDAPPMVLNAAYLWGLSTDVAAQYYSDMLDLSLWVILFTPFASVTSIPDLKTKSVNALMFWRGRHTVAPVTVTNTHRAANQTRTLTRGVH